MSMERFTNKKKFYARIVEIGDILRKPSGEQYLSIIGLEVQIGEGRYKHGEQVPAMNIGEALKILKAAYLAHLHQSTLAVELKMLERLKSKFRFW